MFKKLIVLTAILLSGSRDNFLPQTLITEIKGEEINLATKPINEVMASRFVYTALDNKNNISFNTINRNYNFDKGRLESKIDDSIISIPDGDQYALLREQMDLFVKLGFFKKDKNFIYAGSVNLKGFYVDRIKVVSNNVTIEETKKIKGVQYKLTEEGVKHIAKKNESMFIYLGYLKADIIKLIKDLSNDQYTATYKLSLGDSPLWLYQSEVKNIFPQITSELSTIERSTNEYKINLIDKDSHFEIIKGTNLYE